MFTINQDGGFYDRLPDLHIAIGLAEELLGGASCETTFTVEDDAGVVLASVSNRRITGLFLKQEWGGPKGDTALDRGTVGFDATDAILLMPHVALIALEDHREVSDELGRAHVAWEGPCEVLITASLCRFFGVDTVADITEGHLAYVRNRVNPQQAKEVTVTLSIELKLKVSPGASVSQFLATLRYSGDTDTAGIRVVESQIAVVDVDELDPLFTRSEAIREEYLKSGCQASDVDFAVKTLMAECGALFADDRAAWSFLMEESHEDNEEEEG